MSKTRGVRGAAGWCAIAAILYLLARSLLYAGISALVGVVHPGASLVKPIGVSEVGLGLLQIVNAMKYSGQYGAMFAAVIIVFLPTFLLYLFLSEKIIVGATSGGVKG